MPELPEVETVARGLRTALIGRLIVGVEVRWAHSVVPPDPDDFARRLTGQTVIGVGRRAKWVVIGLDGGDTLLVHLRLTNNDDSNRRCTQMSTDWDPDRGGAREVSPMDVSAENNPRSSASLHLVEPTCCGSEDLDSAREHVLAAMDRCAGLLEHENPYVVLRAAREILQHWRHLCRERFRWTAWSRVARRREARRRVRDLGRQLAGIRKEQGDVAAQNGPYGPDEEIHAPGGEPALEPWEREFEGEEEAYRLNPFPPIDWGDGPDEPEERAPP